MATVNRDFVVKNGLIVNGLTTSGYVTNTAGTIGSIETIPNSGLTNSSITINGTVVPLGGSATLSAGLPVDSPVFTTSMTGPTYTANAVLGTNSNTGIYTYGTLGYLDKYNLGVFAAPNTINDYVQFVIQNKTQGSAASVDFVVSNDTSSANATYGDFGINSSVYTGTGGFNGPNNVYLLAANGDLAIGIATTSNNSIRFITNNSTTDALTINQSGVSNFAVAPTVTGGTAAGFLKANGTIDTTTYLTSTSASATYAALAGATFTGPVVTPAVTTATTGLRLPHGTAPTTPVNGDIWTTTAGLFARINGVTQGPFTASSVSLTANNSFTGTNTFTQVLTDSYSTTNQANQVPALNLSGTPKTGNPLNMATGLLQVGPIATSVTTSSVLADTNILGVFNTPFNDYVQTLFINPSNGSSASADICLYNDQTFEKGGLGSYADIGLSSSTYTTNTFWPAFSTPGGMYIYMQGGSLTIGTQHNGTSTNTTATTYDNDLGFATDDLRRVTLQGGKVGQVSYWTFESNLAGVVFNAPVTTLPTAATSTNSTALTISTGNATGTTSSSGLISIDTGTGTTAAGVINIGTTNAPTVNIGKTTGSVVAYPAAGTTTTAATSAGYMGMPLNAITASGTHTYTFQASDAGKNIYVTGTPTSSTLTINSNANLALPIGTTFVIMNDLGAATNISIAITTDTMQLAGSGTTGTRTLARYGVATVTKVTATKWIISGNGLT